MNLGVLTCGVLVIPFFLCGIVFAVLKGKGAKLVSGFNSMSAREQELYDKEALARDMRNDCFLWSFVMLVGAIASYYLMPSMAVVAFAIWAILFFQEVHLDNHKAFDKYLLNK